MKGKIIFFICACGIILLQACMPSKVIKGTVKVAGDTHEVIVQSEFRDFLKKNSKPSIVLRVPTTTGTIMTTEAEKIGNYNSLYGRIERELMKAGYTVRDRNLLNNLLLSGQNLSYKEIGEKIQTDIMIEIISITSHTILNEEMEVELLFPDKLPKKKNGSYYGTDDFVWGQNKPVAEKDIKNMLTVRNYTVDCKIILVNEGRTVGMTTFYYNRCDGDCSFELSAKRTPFYLYELEKDKNIRVEGSSRWYDGVIFSFELNYLSEMLANDLMKIFRGQ